MPSIPPEKDAPPSRDSLLLAALGPGAAGVVAVLGLALFGGARGGAALLAGVLVLGFSLFWAFRHGADAGVRGPAAEAAPAARRGAIADSRLIEAMPAAVMVVEGRDQHDPTDRRFIRANRAARESLRITRDEGLLVTVVRDPDVLDAADKALFAGDPGEALYEIPGAQDQMLRVVAEPLGEGDEGERLALLIFYDETELRRVERTRVDFLANASHELRTPLASLIGFIDTLRGHARGDEGARDRFLAIMQAQAERMSRLIDDLMSLSRIELNEHMRPSADVDLGLAVTDVVDAVQPIARARGVRVTAAAAPGAARVVGDRDQIVQVVQNLVDNALKYSSRDGEVRVEVEAGLTRIGGGQPATLHARHALLTPDAAAGAYALVRVTDSGPGLQREHLPRLTERFYRVEGQKSGDQLGTGLGLAIVKHIMNRHRGGLTVESAPGEGAAFAAYFPMAEIPAPPLDIEAIVTKAS